MSHARACLIASSIALLAVGCQDGGSHPTHADATKAQMLDQAAQLNNQGQQLRADALEKKRQGQSADGAKEAVQADKMISDAKMMKDQALLRDSKVSD